MDQSGPAEHGARPSPAVPETGPASHAHGQTVWLKCRRFPFGAGAWWLQAGRSRAQPLQRGPPLRLQLLRQVLHVLPESGDARARPHRWAAVQLRSVREALHTVGSPKDAPERPHRGAAVRLRALREEIRREAEPEDPPAEAPSRRAGGRGLLTWLPENSLLLLSSKTFDWKLILYPLISQNIKHS